MVYFVQIRPSGCLIFVRGSLFFGLRNNKINQPNCNLIISLSNCSGPLKKKSQSELIFVESVTFYTLNREKIQDSSACTFRDAQNEFNINRTIFKINSKKFVKKIVFRQNLRIFLTLCDQGS